MPLLGAFETVHVTLLGYYLVPEQTSPEQAREEFEDDAREALEAVEQDLEAEDIEVDTRLVFTPDLADTVERLTEEHAFDAVLTSGGLPSLHRIVVPVHAAEQPLERTVAFVRHLAESADADVLLLRITEPDADEEDTAPSADELRRRCEEAGIPDDRFDLVDLEAEDTVEAIAGLEASYDLVVIAESGPSFLGWLFGEVHDRVREQLEGPVVVILQPPEEG
jgi:nucleotide-binding universal stress UspA family protein